MKFSKLLKMVFGLAGLFSMGVVEGDGGGGGGALDTNEAAGLFSSLMDGEPIEKEVAETPEAAAERLATEEAGGTAATDTPGDAPADEGKISFEVDGKVVVLTRAELADSYKNGLRQADYTQKTMAAADARKTADTEASAARAERATFAQQLHEYSIKMNGDLQEMSQVNLQELLANDPVGYLEHQRIANERQANLSKAQQQLGVLNKQHQAEQDQAASTYRAEQHQELIDKLPEWKDAAKAKAESDLIKTYLSKQGMSADKINGLNDHVDVVLHRKAMLYDALIERAATATKKVAALPTRVERPGNGTAPTDGRTDAMKRLSQSGSVADAAAVFSRMF